MTLEKVLQANAITKVLFNKRKPLLVVVEAEGTVSSSGWSNGQLVPRVYVKPPADGIQDFDFLAEKPTGIVLWVLSAITGHGEIEMAPWMRGVRIHGQHNSVEHRFFGRCKPLYELAVLDDEKAASTKSDKEADKEEAEVEYSEAFSDIGDEETFEHVATRCHSFDLLTISNFPEVKTEWQNKCILRIGGKCRASAKVPVLYRRTSRLALSVKICWPSEDDIIRAVEDCAKQAVAAGVLAGLITGSLQAAAAALKGYLISCLKSKGIGFADDISVGLQQVKRPGPWKRV